MPRLLAPRDTSLSAAQLALTNIAHAPRLVVRADQPVATRSLARCTTVWIAKDDVAIAFGVHVPRSLTAVAPVLKLLSMVRQQYSPAAETAVRPL